MCADILQMSSSAYHSYPTYISMVTATFNQNNSCIAVGFPDCYKVYNCDPFGECFSKNDDGGASIMEMLFSTSLVAVVGTGDKPSTSTRKLKIVNTKRNTIICELSFSTAILAVKLNRKRLVVVLYDQLFIYDISCMKQLKTIETVPNRLAIASLSADDSSILAYPSSDSSSSNERHQLGETVSTGGSGGVVLYDALNCEFITIIEAHKAQLQQICLSKDGSLLATTSHKGTLIRVFSTSAPFDKLYEFRRGSYQVRIQHLSFSHDNRYLSCCSNTGTIHFFKLDSSSTEEDGSEADREERLIPQQGELSTEESTSVTNIFSQKGKYHLKEYLQQVSSRLPTNVQQNFTSLIEPQRDFAHIKLPSPSPTTIATIDSSNNVVVFSGTNLYVYHLKPGECVLLKKHSLT
ncbi:Phosphoinositide binding protein [Komagataella phaffii GS115]|uniref:Phosphoinositide binding protein n=2 Tax=Komagataella phaffii TaxID=460519 RepID=C4R691_KOMPG|nr:Phosphoinositide binding protein [Komagataella phaffii GS115]AOA63853.1 GQ67_04145T0 [Komagataella phaffii]AOA68516.1 GQ68_04118T0 [Komagataella phaffii GS115]CAY71077.1 Phosphoinositide binding protein [Komagataella phaffii GS115]